MNDIERQQAQAEALKAAAASRSADRGRLWAGMNRYLSAEATHAHKVAEEERASDDASTPDESDTE